MIIPVGNGTLLLGAYYGFKELMENGLVEKMPKLVAIQAVNCAPLASAYASNQEVAEKVENSGTL